MIYKGPDNSWVVIKLVVKEQRILSSTDIQAGKSQESTALYCEVQEEVLTWSWSGPPVVIYVIWENGKSLCSRGVSVWWYFKIYVLLFHMLFHDVVCLVSISVPTLLTWLNAALTDARISGSVPVGPYIASSIWFMFRFKSFFVASRPVRKT